MSAQRKLISIIAHSPHRLAITPRPFIPAFARSALALGPRPRSRSIVITPTLLRPAAERGSESTSNKDDTKPVPSEQLTEEAKQAEPDAAEQVEEVSLHYISFSISTRGPS